MPPPRINAIICDSFQIATDFLHAREYWTPIDVHNGRWRDSLGYKYRIFTEANQLRGHRFNLIVRIEPVSPQLSWMAEERKR
jgi:hypothetical protein